LSVTEQLTPDRDSYQLRAEDVRNPPRTLGERLRYLGPGIVLTASVVGSGELIVTTSLGAKAGFALLWLVIVGAAVKVWVQVELARWTILNGGTALEGYAAVPPRIGRMGWINWLWIGLDIAKNFQRGGVIGASAAVCSIALPLAGDELSRTSLVIWTIIVTGVSVLLMSSSRYSVVERVTTISVVLFTTSIVGLVLVLPFTPYFYSASDLGSGLSFTIPAGAIGLALAMFGSTGVGADDMTNYTYWCLEKGYARWTGPDDGSEERAVRAAGWLKVMQLDVLVSWVVCTLTTLSFYIVGASVLGGRQAVPEGNDVITSVSRIYTDTLGTWAEAVFLAGAIAVLFSTHVAAVAAVPRLWTNTLGLMGLIDWNDLAVRTRWLRIFTVVLPAVWAAMYLFVQSPLLLLQIGATGNAIFLLAVLVAVWRLRTTQVDRRFRAGRWITPVLLVSTAAVGGLAVYSLLEVFGISAGG
jgi:Mn2+/Fe2+ NRAMP family transporter